MKCFKIFFGSLIGVAVFLGVFAMLELKSWLDCGMNMHDLDYYANMGLMMIVLVNVALLPLYIIELFSGVKRGISKTFKDSETYIYTRDLPEYNAAIAGALYDFKADFEQEFVGGVLDLIAKGYITENADSLEVDVQKVKEAKINGELLNCENCIVKLCQAKAARLRCGVIIDFAEALEEDLYNLGFYKKQTWLKNNKKMVQERFENGQLFDQTFLFVMIAAMIIIAVGIVYSLKLMIAVFVIFCLVFLIIQKVTRLTKKGKEEKESMTKLKFFLERETSFGKKEDEEKKLWDRYPAFAVALGVNKEMTKAIMKKMNIKD